jgi:hypothetical protein
MKHLCGKATKKPVEIDWFLYQGYSVTNLKELMAWVQSFKVDFHTAFEFGPGGKGDLRVKTLEGSSYTVPNNYIIIRGVQGEFYPCDPEIFKQTYTIVQ